MSSLAAGAVVAGRYRLDELIGQGGMGVVWSATHELTGGRVALKFLKAEIRGSADLRKRLLREVRAATKIDHPNVVTIRDVLESADGDPIIVMELLEGETVAQRIHRGGPMAVVDVARVMLPVLSAIRAAHDHGIVHRDLKPENVFLASTATGEVPKVLDFGIAKWLPTSVAPASAMTESGAVIGTPAYMAPEQLTGEKKLDQRADVWSLGLIVWEMLTGARAVDGDNYGQIVKRVLTERLPSVRERRPDVPADLDAVIARMLVRELGDRMADVRELADVLARHGDGSFRESPVSHRADRGSGKGRVSAPSTPTPTGEGAALAATERALQSDALASTGATPRSRVAYLVVALVVVGGTAVVAVGTRAFSSNPRETPDRPASGASSSSANSTSAAATPAPAGMSGTSSASPGAAVASASAPSPSVEPTTSVAPSATGAALPTTTTTTKPTSKPSTVAAAVPTPSASASTAPPIAKPPAVGSGAAPTLVSKPPF